MTKKEAKIKILMHLWNHLAAADADDLGFFVDDLSREDKDTIDSVRQVLADALGNRVKRLKESY